VGLSPSVRRKLFKESAESDWRTVAGWPLDARQDDCRESTVRRKVRNTSPSDLTIRFNHGCQMSPQIRFAGSRRRIPRSISAMPDSRACRTPWALTQLAFFTIAFLIEANVQQSGVLWISRGTFRRESYRMGDGRFQSCPGSPVALLDAANYRSPPKALGGDAG
jgi:hypothetical protein